MILLPPDLRTALCANAAASRGDERLDPVPVVKLFNPPSAGTWLATKLYDDGDTLFGLGDLGFGCPGLGTFSLSEIERIRLPFGLAIERDIGFATTSRLPVWAECARRAGSIIWAETLLNRAAQSSVPDLPARRDQPGGG